MPSLHRYLDPLLVERLRTLQLPARRLAEGGATGRHKSPRVLATAGASVEFRHHRFYSPGDEPRQIDWRLVARTDRFFVRQFEQETNLRCMIALDASGSMNYPPLSAKRKFDFAVRLAAALGYLLLGNGEHAGLAIFSQQVQRWIAPLAGTEQLSRMAQAMERTVPNNPGSAKSLHEVCRRLRRRSMVIVLSDLFYPADQIAAALAHLRHNRHETILLRILHRDEVEFPFKSWTKLDGLENDGSRTVDPALMRRIYLENFARHERAVRDACAKQRAELATFYTDEPLEESLSRFLTRRLLRNG